MKAQTIRAIISDLQSISEKPGVNRYALEENITFFSALSTLPHFLYWLFFHMPVIDASKLLELSDFGFPHWQRQLQHELLAIEKPDKPDIIGPLRDLLVKTITHLPQSQKPIVLVNVGCGTMEPDRQMIERLQKLAWKQPIIIFGIDNSLSSLSAAKENLSSLPIHFICETHLSHPRVTTLIKQAQKYPFTVVLTQGDAFSLHKYFTRGSVDIVYHSKLKHHLPVNKKAAFDRLLTTIAKHVIEFDDFRGWYLIVFSLLFNWQKPVLMNGAIFSCLRVPTKIMLKNTETPGWFTHVFPIGGYLRTYDAPQDTEQRLALSMHIPITLNTIRLGNYHIRYLKTGHGKPLLLLHGANMGWGQWYPNIKDFAKHFTIYAIDLPGSGKSTYASEKPLNPQDDWLNATKAFIKAMNLNHFDIIGHSIGGWVSMKLALDQSIKLHKIVLVDSIGSTYSVPLQYTPLCLHRVAVFLSHTVMNPTREHMKSFVTSVMYTPQIISEQFIDYYFDSIKRGSTLHPFLFMHQLIEPFHFKKDFILTEFLPKIPYPTLIISGDHDPFVPYAICSKAYSLIPHHEVALFRHTGHVPSMESSHAFNTKALHFLLTNK